jgi:monofunctional biosynthetic peptidoglycan transglycosylase
VLVCAAAFVVVAYVYLTLPDVRTLARTNPRTTAFMELRAADAARQGRTLRRSQIWVPYSRISQNLKRAVLVAEDSAFWEHEGIDIEQIRESMQVNWKQGRAIRGASTITQQLAKNLYLSPSRDPMRKLRELIIARRLEAALPKARIFEIYLNVIEWGEGIWGAEAAARAYFGVPASALTAPQAALLAGAIINPRVLNPARPGTRLFRRQRLILARMGQVTPPSAVPVVAAMPESTPSPTDEGAQQLIETEAEEPHIEGTTIEVPAEPAGAAPSDPTPPPQPAPFPEPPPAAPPAPAPPAAAPPAAAPPAAAPPASNP